MTSLFIWPTYVRAAPFFIAALGVLSVIDLGLGIAHGVQLSHEKVDAYFIRHYGHGPTSAQLAFYSATVPFVSALYCVVDAAFFYFLPSLRREIFSLSGAVLLVAGWLCQVAFWTNCEEIGRDDQGLQRFCPQWAMRKTSILDRQGLETSVQKAKYSFGWILTLGYLVYMTILAITVSKAKSHQKKMAQKDFIDKSDI